MSGGIIYLNRPVSTQGKEALYEEQEYKAAKILQISWLVNFYLGFNILSLKSNPVDRESKLRYYMLTLTYDHLLIRD